jgi:hypothetical protein
MKRAYSIADKMIEYYLCEAKAQKAIKKKIIRIVEGVSVSIETDETVMIDCPVSDLFADS